MSNARELAQIPSTPSGRRNLIINGAMNVAQRGTSFTTSGYTLDRLYYTLSGATATVTQEDMSASDRSTYGFEHYAKLVTTTGNNNSGFYFRIEGKDLYHLIDNKFTFSFLAKGTNPNGGSLEFLPRWYDGTNLDSGTTQSITLNSTWTKHTVTFEFPTITNASTTAANFQGQIALIQPNADTSTNAWELNITGVQLEVGTVATEFEHRSFGEEMQSCQRYYQVVDFGNSYGPLDGYFGAGNYLHYTSSRTVTMRTDPSATITYSATSNLQNNPEIHTSDNAENIRIVARATNTGRAYAVFNKYTADAEL